VYRYRVLNIITRLEQGGAPLALLETIRRIDREQFDITVVAGQTEDQDRNLNVSVMGFDLPVIEVPALRRSVHPVRDVSALCRLIQIIRQGEYDLVHTHTSKAGVIGRMAAKICGVPAIVHSSHGTILHGYFSPAVTRIFAILEKAAASASHRIICLTRQEIGQYLDAGIGRPDQYTYIFNGIDVSAFEERKGDRSSLRTSLGFKPEEIVCISVGRLVPVKGLSDLLSAFAIAHNQNPELRLLLVGDGELRQDLEREVQELKIGDVVQLVGWREDIPELLDVADLFVLTSHNEGLGLVLVEAMVKKLPVVATAVGGVPEVVIDGVTGSLVPAGDSVAIASAIARFAENGEMRASMGQRGYERANEFFTIDKTVQYTEDLYKTLLGSPA
jgi:glycosyltransferase involved in cell wall biosynthesis